MIIEVVTVIKWRPAIETRRMLGTTAVFASRVVCVLSTFILRQPASLLELFLSRLGVLVVMPCEVLMLATGAVIVTLSN